MLFFYSSVLKIDIVCEQLEIDLFAKKQEPCESSTGTYTL